SSSSFYHYAHPRDLHSFPTRRSSDLGRRGDPMTSGRTVAHVTCLGCGCACDDITVVVERDRIASLVNACPLGQTWFGDGTVPERSEEHTSELQSRSDLVCRLLLEKKK